MQTAKQYVDRLKRLDLLRSLRRGYSIYVLRVDGEIEYVGFTSDPTTRLSQHKHGRRGFDIRLEVKCVVETQEEAARVESGLVEILKRRGHDLTNVVKHSLGGTCALDGEGEPLALPPLVPRSSRLTKAMNKEEVKARRAEIRRKILGSMQMMEIEK